MCFFKHLSYPGTPYTSCDEFISDWIEKHKQNRSQVCCDRTRFKEVTVVHLENVIQKEHLIIMVFGDFLKAHYIKSRQKLLNYKHINQIPLLFFLFSRQIYHCFLQNEVKSTPKYISDFKLRKPALSSNVDYRNELINFFSRQIYKSV